MNKKQKPSGDAGWEVIQDTGAVYTVSMSADSWIEMAPNPRRRNVERHAKKSHWEDAEKATGAAFEQLRWVVAGEANGTIYKVDGHSRGYLWANGGLPKPDSVFVTVYRCGSMDELKSLYSAYDTQAAAETMFDKVTGAYHEHGLELKSQRLKSGTIVDALHIALRGKQRSASRSGDEGFDMDLYEAVGFFRDELELLDSINPQLEVFMTGVVAAALMALALDPADIEFFKRISENEGSKQEGMNDPVEGVLVHISGIKKARSAWVKKHHVELAGIVLRALDAWKKGPDKAADYWQKGSMDPIKLDGLVKALTEKRKSIGEEDPQ